MSSQLLLSASSSASSSRAPAGSRLSSIAERIACSSSRFVPSGSAAWHEVVSCSNATTASSASSTRSHVSSLDLRCFIHTGRWCDEMPLTATCSAIVPRNRVRLPVSLYSSRMRAWSYETLCPTMRCATFGSLRGMSWSGSAFWSRSQGYNSLWGSLRRQQQHKRDIRKLSKTSNFWGFPSW